MNKKTTPEKFWKAILDTINSEKNFEKLRRGYGDNRKTTKTLTKLLENMGKGRPEFESVMQEHWPRIDISFFDKEAEEEWGKWATEVAIEIENNFDKCWEEINKLFAINAGLKVLITYTDGNSACIRSWIDGGTSDRHLPKWVCKKGTRGKIDRKEIDDTKTVKSIYCSRKYHQKDDQYLIILGPTNKKGLDSKPNHGFQAFLFDGKNETREL